MMQAEPSSFFKRSQIRERVEKWIEALQQGYRQNIGLIGPEGFGKSCLLASIYKELSSRPSLLPIYVNADVLDYDHFVDRWLHSLLEGLFLIQNTSCPGNFQSALAQAENAIPRTVEKIRHLKKMLRRGEKNAASVRELFSLSGLLAEETGRKTVVMIDEFQGLEHVPAPDPFALFGKEIMVEKGTLYLVTSSSLKKAREIFHDKLSLLFGNFEVIEMLPLGFEEVALFLKRRLPNRLFTDIQKKFIIHLTDGIPYYLDLLLDRLECLDSAGEENVSSDKLIEAFRQELFDFRGRMALKFSSRLQLCQKFAKDNAAYIRTFLAISEGRRKVLGISTYIGKKILETKKILQRLVQEEMIEKRGSFYTLEDPLFRFWLKEVYQKRNRQHLPFASDLSASLTGALSDLFKQVEAETTLDVTTRVESLFKEFRNDLLEVEHRKIRCPHFSEIAFRPSNGRLFPLFARKSNIR
ncbi:MAG TPA: hypothetical protein VD913_00265, partial [bacterium]|nr:hypothetical protein [bacterium]